MEVVGEGRQRAWKPAITDLCQASLSCTVGLECPAAPDAWEMEAVGGASRRLGGWAIADLDWAHALRCLCSGPLAALMLLSAPWLELC